MSSSHFFEGATNAHFSGNTTFTHANTVSINNYGNRSTSTESKLGSFSCRTDDDQWLTLCRGQRLRWIEMCDINLRQEVSLDRLHVLDKFKSTNPFRGRQGSAVKIQRRVQGAEIVQFDRQFTVVSLEPENEEDLKKIWTVLEQYYGVALSRRRVWLTQLFGVGRSMIPTLIYHDEVVGGATIFNQYGETPIVWFYLAYIYIYLVLDVNDDGTLQKLSFPLSTRWWDWTFNLRTLSFQYDVTTALSTGDNSQLSLRTDRPLPLPRDCNPPLDSNEIIRAVPDYLQLISGFRTKIRIDPKTALVSNGLLTFGTIVDITRPRILGYFPSISSPVWSCELSTFGAPDVVAKYSTSVPSLVDLTFTKNDVWQMKIQFSLRLPSKDYRRLQTAYLIQSFPFYNNHLDSGNLVLVDELSFYLTGTFTSDPSNCDPPTYLHVPPLSPTWINDMPCLRGSSNTRFFYWSFDRSGKMEIPEEHWAKFGIPRLEVVTFLGSNWWSWLYAVVLEYLRLRNFDFQSGQRFANEHGYPILVEGSPHVQAETRPESGDLRNLGEKQPKSKIQRMVTWVGKRVCKWKGSSGRKEKDKEEAHGSVDTQAGSVGQASIVEVTD